MRHMLGTLSPNYFERTKRYMMFMANRQGTDLTVSGAPPLTLPNSLGKPLKAWSVDLLPYQEGTGDPSPSNVRPIHGTDKVNWFVEESYDQSATPKAVITLPQTVYTGTVGSEGGESRWASKTIGDYRWSYIATSTDYPFGFFYINLWGKASGSLNIMCSEYKTDENFRINNVCFGNSQNNVVYIIDGDYSDPSEFVRARGSTQLVYKLATPTTFAVPSVTIPTPTGTATTWATAEDGTVESMEVTYVGKA